MTELSFLVIYCSDLESNVKFYKELGLDFVIEKHGKGPTHYASTFSNSTVMELYPSTNGMITNTTIGLVVSRSFFGENDKIPKKLKDPDGRLVMIYPDN